ncbi:MAG: VIT1/CCC1 transporter family protein [Candidatus Hydrogenedentes bacterium]|nr:VIT1/CCC1 transporter family protein [Candidatus Hydrogenedentota bacterium]
MSEAKILAAWQHHWRDEADAAFLYRVLADTETDASRKDIFRRLAEIEDRHVGLWRRILEEHEVTLPTPKPSARARLLAYLARKFGPAVLLSLLLREEGEEVKGYLKLHRESPAGAARATALTLAQESAQHAAQLRELTGTEGEPWHRTGSGGFLRNVVYGFNDGLTANFGLVAGVLGANVQTPIVMLSGVAGMIADALSMGSSGYLAAKSEGEVYAHEIAMEKEELRLMPEVEEQELALIYEAKGIEGARARLMAREVMQNPSRALDEKVREELKIGEAHSTPLKEGWVTGLSTAVGAFIPVAPFLFLQGFWAVWISFTLSMVSHFAVGAARSVFTGRGFLRSGFDMFVVGLGVAVVGYIVGDLIVK